MQDIISNFVDDIGSVYSGFLSNFISNLLGTIFLIILIRIIYELVSTIFPGIKGLVYTLFKPFRLLHIWFHIQAAKNINEKKGNEKNKATDFSVLFSTGMGSNSEQSLISVVSTKNFTIKDAITIAKAPLMPSLVMLIFLILIGPIMNEGIFIFIHLYFLLGITLVMLPSGHDNLFVFNTILTKVNLSAWYFIFPFISFSLTTALYTYKYQILNSYPPFWWVEPLVMGLYSSWLYLILLAGVIWFTGEKDEALTNTKSKENYPSTDLEFDEEDLEFLRNQQYQLQFREMKGK